MPRKATDASSGEKLLRLFQKLMLNRGRHYQNELAKWLNCSPQTVMRLAEEISKQVGKIWDSGVEHNRRWYEIKPQKSGKFGIEFEELRYLAVCRDLAAPMLPKQVKERVNQSIHDIAIELLSYESREMLNKPVLQFYSRGRIDYTPHFKTITLLQQAMEDHSICELMHKSGGEKNYKKIRFAPKRFAAIGNVLYVVGVKTNDKLEHVKTISPAVHRIKNVTPTIFKKDFEISGDDPADFGLPWHEPKTYVIEFKPGKASDYVRERLWTDNQQIKELENGGVELTITTRSGPEVEAWIRGFGDEATWKNKRN